LERLRQSNRNRAADPASNGPGVAKGRRAEDEQKAEAEFRRCFFGVFREGCHIDEL